MVMCWTWRRRGDGVVVCRVCVRARRCFNLIIIINNFFLFLLWLLGSMESEL